LLDERPIPNFVFARLEAKCSRNYFGGFGEVDRVGGSKIAVGISGDDIFIFREANIFREPVGIFDIRKRIIFGNAVFDFRVGKLRLDDYFRQFRAIDRRVRAKIAIGISGDNALVLDKIDCGRVRMTRGDILECGICGDREREKGEK